MTNLNSVNTNGNKKQPLLVTVTGASGQIAYSLLFRIANGDMLGKNQPIILKLLEIADTKAQTMLKGVMMEIADCVFPLLVSMQSYTDPMLAFKDANYALLLGARPRGPGMERSDLLLANASIFTAQGKALNAVAQPTVKVLVVGNPANTNAYIAMRSAPNLDKSCFSAMLRLDHDRACGQIAEKVNYSVESIENCIVWGNHSPTMYPDLRFVTVAGQPLRTLITNQSSWNSEIFIPTVAKRGTSVIEIRGMSSAASAANAAINHMRDWHMGTNGKWVTMGIASDGSYDIPKDMIFGYPVTCEPGNFTIVQNLSIDSFSRDRLNLTAQELLTEQEAITKLL